jgi:hypothetical protein
MSAIYIEMFQDFVNQLDDEELSLGFYQQDGVTCHTSAASMAEIESFFPSRVISKGLWPPRSPVLTPSDFFLWGHLKVCVYMSRPHMMEDLRENIQREIQVVYPQVLAATFRNMQRRVRLCLEAQGGRFQHML